jgi:hypothetical protein
VLITREAALKALADADEVVALRAEKKVLSQASDDLKELLNKMRIEFAEKSGENTDGLEAERRLGPCNYRHASQEAACADGVVAAG